MASVEVKRAGPVPYREAVPEGEPSRPALVGVHGFPESSRMWVPLLEAAAEAGHRAAAPDLYGLGDCDGSFGPATFENTRARFDEWMDSLGLGEVVVVVHDWGGFIGLSWACDHPDDTIGLVISAAGFFADGRWHDLAETLRSPQGEAIVGAVDRDGFAALINAGDQVFDEAEVDAYWAPFADDGRGQRATLEFYRSMDFAKLGPWQGKLGELGVPALILWGAGDPYAPMSSARRFEREIPGARLVALEGAGHFVFDQERQRCVAEVLELLAS
jgi:pimeloyl-ACP methyl ester carboxylesterase